MIAFAISAAQVAVAEPPILGANTYFWSPATAASSRRRNEDRQQAAVASYLAQLGFQVERHGDAVIALKAEVEVIFSYQESCTNVYKSLSVTRNGKNSNITTLRKIARGANLKAA